MGYRSKVTMKNIDKLHYHTVVMPISWLLKLRRMRDKLRDEGVTLEVPGSMIKRDAVSVNKLILLAIYEKYIA